MSNSRVLTTGFSYFAPDTLEEALTLLKQHKGCPLAGGTDLLNGMKTGEKAPEAIICLMNLQGLDYITFDKELVIGATARLADIEASPAVGEKYPALREAVNAIGGTQIRNMGTLAGNLCNASPGADTPPILIALGAEVRLSREAGNGTIESRTVSLEDFFTGPKRTVLKPGELLTSVTVPEPEPGSGQSFRRIARVKLDIAKINCGVYIRRNGDRIDEVRVAFGSAAPTPVRVRNTEEVLRGKAYNREILDKAAGIVSKDISPISDIRSTAGYRNHTAAVLLKDALAEAWERAGGM